MPSLREIQLTMLKAILNRDDADAAAHIVTGGIAPANRIAIYRHTFESSLTKALRLAFPAVDKLVGTEFFDGAAMQFIHERPPHSGYLDEYGGEFADFLEAFPPAFSLKYLADVARLEWAINRAIHAADARALEVSSLTKFDDAAHERLRFTPHPSLGLLRLDWPADVIWRAVLDDDDAALGALELVRGPIALIVQRSEEGIDVSRVSDSAWRFTYDLCGGRPLGDVIEAHPEVEAPIMLAELLSNGRFAGCELPADRDGTYAEEVAP